VGAGVVQPPSRGFLQAYPGRLIPQLASFHLLKISSENDSQTCIFTAVIKIRSIFRYSFATSENYFAI